MKSRKIILTVLVQLIVFVGFTQQKNYEKKGSSISTTKIYGERVELKETSSSLSQTKKTEIFSLIPIAPILPIVTGLAADHGLSFANNQVKKSLKKYTGEYAASVTISNPNNPKGLTFKRSIKTYPNANWVNASQFDFALDGDSLGFWYNISVNEMKVSKAKTKNSYYFIDLAFEIEITYLAKEGKKSALKLKPIYYNLFDFLNGTHPMTIQTDRFPIGKISEVSVKVTESNPHKIKLEKIQSFLEDNEDLLSDLFSKLKDE